jgi:hypothetical protein
MEVLVLKRALVRAMKSGLSPLIVHGECIEGMWAKWGMSVGSSDAHMKILACLLDFPKEKVEGLPNMKEFFPVGAEHVCEPRTEMLISLVRSIAANTRCSVVTAGHTYSFITHSEWCCKFNTLTCNIRQAFSPAI